MNRAIQEGVERLEVLRRTVATCARRNQWLEAVHTAQMGRETDYVVERLTNVRDEIKAMSAYEVAEDVRRGYGDDLRRLYREEDATCDTRD